MPTQAENQLSDIELFQLVERVFAPQPNERRLAVLVDMPDEVVLDHPAWAARRELAADWADRLDRAGYDVQLVLYRNVGTNNAELPVTVWRHPPTALPAHADNLSPISAVPLEDIFKRTDLVLALTELSATAPLKLMAPRFRVRAATMPGFRPAMIPALRLDYVEVDRRVRALADLLTAASGADLDFRVGDEEHHLHLDLRHRSGHASGGLLHEVGAVGNLPSGEAYIVPYEGEDDDDPSRSAGVLPVQLGDEVVCYKIAENKAVEVIGDGPKAKEEAERIDDEPAYANLAELGLGVLAAFGIEPIGSTLLDEKLGLHIAFGRSDHFGGQVGPGDFSQASAVVHIDRVYLPQTQPKVGVTKVDLITGDDDSRQPLMRDGRYVVEF